MTNNLLDKMAFIIKKQENIHLMGLYETYKFVIKANELEFFHLNGLYRQQLKYDRGL